MTIKQGFLVQAEVAMALIALGLAGCGASGVGTGSRLANGAGGAPSTSNNPRLAVRARAVPGRADCGATVVSTVETFLGVSQVDLEGGFELQVNGSNGQLAVCRDVTGRAVGLGFVGDDARGHDLDAASTAEALVYLHTALVLTPRETRAEACAIIRSDVGFAALVNRIAADQEAGEFDAADRSALVEESLAACLAGVATQLEEGARQSGGCDDARANAESGAIGRFGISVDSEAQVVRNARRRFVFVAVNEEGQSPIAGDFALLSHAGGKLESCGLFPLIDLFVSEQGVSALAASSLDLGLEGRSGRFVVTTAGSSLRQADYPAPGTPQHAAVLAATTGDLALLVCRLAAVITNTDVLAPDFEGIVTERILAAAADPRLSGDLLAAVADCANGSPANTLSVAVGLFTGNEVFRVLVEEIVRDLVVGLDAERFESLAGLVAICAPGRVLTPVAATTADLDFMTFALTESPPVETFTVDLGVQELDRQFIVVLRWGEQPADLDSHLTGPSPDGEGRFHLFFPNAESRNGSQFPDDFALDLDDVTSFGPETIVVLRPRDGIYRFSVHDFSNRTSSSSDALSRSGAVVEVFQAGNAEALRFEVPQDQPGTVWTVFEMNGTDGEVEPVNAMSFEVIPGRFASFVTVSKD